MIRNLPVITKYSSVLLLMTFAFTFATGDESDLSVDKRPVDRDAVETGSGGVMPTVTYISKSYLDLAEIQNFTRLSECHDGCDVYLKGAVQTMVLSVDENGMIDEYPTLYEHVIDFQDLHQVELELTHGSYLLRVGPYHYAVWVLSNGQLVFAPSKRDLSRQSSNQNIAASFGDGGTFNPGEEACEEYTRTDSQGCEELSDGSIRLWAVYYVYDCHNSLIRIDNFDYTIAAELAHLVDCSIMA